MDRAVFLDLGYERLLHSFFLFAWKLPVDLDLLKNEDIFLTPRIRVSKKTSQIITFLRKVDPEDGKHLVRYAYPGYGLPGYGIHHRVLIGDIQDSSPGEIWNELWNTLALLRVIKPLCLDVCGGIPVSTSITTAYASRIKTYLNPFQFVERGCMSALPEFVYGALEIHRFKELWNVYHETLLDNTSFLSTVLHSFARTTLTEKIKNTETFFQKLFPILDCLSGNPNHKHSQVISNSLGNWLQELYRDELNDLGVNFKEIIKAAWDRFRHHFSHLSHSITPPSFQLVKVDCQLDIEPHETRDALFAVHEVCRLALLELLSLPEEHRTKLKELPSIDDKQESNNDQRKEAFQKFYESLSKQSQGLKGSFWEPHLHGPLFNAVQTRIRS